MNIYLFLILYYWITPKINVMANICSYANNAESICCEGWVKNVYGDCIKSECFQDCGNGRCVGLNVCECYDGTTRSDSCPIPKQMLCPNDCSNNGKCIDTKCVCHPGFTGTTCNGTRISTCYVKVDRGLCMSTPEGIQLTREECCSVFQMAWGNPCVFCNGNNKCGKGYIWKNGACEDIDECRLNGICLNGNCINERGSFKCECPPQYILNENTIACQQHKDVCEKYGSNCGMYGKCIQLITGDYKCVCIEPYEASDDEKRCTKRRTYNVCKMFPKLCQPHGDCEPSGLSYTCICQNGFVQSHDRKSCRINLDAPNTNNEDLCRNSEVAQRCIKGQCISESGSYKCLCFQPYQASSDSQKCILSEVTIPEPIRDCQRREYYTMCQGGQCVDTYDGYYCNCRPGYNVVDNGRRCDRDGRTPEISSIYCLNKAYVARCQGGQCIGDSTYGFKCICLPGYSVAQDGRECYPDKSNPCSSKGYRCLPGSCQTIGEYDYRCHCPPSYVTSLDSRSCSPNAIITTATSTYCNIESNRARCATGECVPDDYYGFKCICTKDYKVAPDGRACDKISASDPCSSNRHKCLNGQCRVIGENDYECDCPQYLTTSYDRRSCSRYEISTKPPSTYCDITDYRERCVNGECVPDSYYGFKCICTSGYTVARDGRACYRNENSESVCNKYQSNCYGGKCIDLNNSNYKCICEQEYHVAEDGRSCIKDRNSICEIYGSRCLTGTCYNTGYQDYICICMTGYLSIDNGKGCAKERYESICSKYESRCNGGRCVEVGTSEYLCQCKEGYRKSEDSKSCIREIQSQLCATHGHRCNGNACRDIRDDYQCICSQDYVTGDDRRSCEKKKTDERCSQFKSRCRDGLCFDVQQGYLCICSSEYSVSDDGRYCVTKDTIVLKTNQLEDSISFSTMERKYCSNKDLRQGCNPGICVNLNTGYTCQCPNNFRVDKSGHQCIRDETKCPHCYYGCTYVGFVSKCKCQGGYKDMFQTGLCIKIEKLLEYSLGESHCENGSSNKRTFVIRFKGLFADQNYTVQLAYQKIVSMIQKKESQSAKLNFCVPIRKLQKRVRRLENQISQDLYSWQAACIFDC